MNILLLPTEVWIHIIKYCCPKSVAYLNQTCKTLQNISNMDIIWIYFCKRDYGISRKGQFNSFGDMYKKFLHKYRYMLGMYMLKIEDWGGLAEINYHGGLTVWTLKNNRSASDEPLTKSAVFKFEINPQGKIARVLCLKADPPHEADFIRKGRKILFRCSKQSLHDVYEGRPYRNVFHAMLFDTCIAEGLRFLPIKIPHKTDVPESLLLNGSVPDALIEPGLYRCITNNGTNDFFVFRYRDEMTLLGFRVALSNDIGALESCFKISLQKWFLPTAEEQSSMDNLSDIKPKTRGCAYPPYLPDQDFCVLREYPISSALKAVITKCKARYHGYGRLFLDQHEHVHMIVFSKNRIGIYWIDNMHLSLYDRANQKFTEKKVTALYANF